MTEEIRNTQDVIDSRDIIERINDLENCISEDEDNTSELDDDQKQELDALKALAEEASNYSEDWEHGAILVHDSYFTTYAQQLAEDIGAISGDESWPCMHIDWEAAARDLKMDYTAVDFDGERYWVR